MIGFSPRRCSSVAQTSIGVSGCWALASATACSSLFLTPPPPPARPRAERGGGPRARFWPRPADPLERLPAALGQHRGKPEFARPPGRHLRAGPQAAVRGWLTKTRLELPHQVRPNTG